MHVGLSRRIPAGKPGTKKLMEKYGDDLICVRYRYDAEKKIKYKSVEIIIDRGLWNHKKRNEKEVAIRISYYETGLRELIKEAGGKWDHEKKVWIIKYGKVRALGITDRIKKD